VVVCLSAGNLDLVPDSLCNMTARPADVEDCNRHRCGTGRHICRLITHGVRIKELGSLISLVDCSSCEP